MSDKKSILSTLSDNVLDLASGAGVLVSGAKDSIVNVFSSNENKENEVNITHYYCIPDPVNVGKYLIHTSREVSNGIDESSFPNQRIFHVHKEEAIDQIRKSMIDMDTEAMRDKHSKDSFSGDTLVNVASHIDKANEKISGGVLIAGAATCIFNPVLGVALITKSLVPSIGAKVASELLGGSGNSINKWSKDKVDEKVDKDVKDTHKKTKPIIKPNIILYKIDKAINDRDYNPLLETTDLDIDVLLTVPMIKEVYGDFLGKGFFENKTLSDPLIEYINYLIISYENIS
jgi:hypothetical protein